MEDYMFLFGARRSCPIFLFCLLEAGTTSESLIGQSVAVKFGMDGDLYLGKVQGWDSA